MKDFYTIAYYGNPFVGPYWTKDQILNQGCRSEQLNAYKKIREDVDIDVHGEKQEVWQDSVKGVLDNSFIKHVSCEPCPEPVWGFMFVAGFGHIYQPIQDERQKNYYDRPEDIFINGWQWMFEDSEIRESISKSGYHAKAFPVQKIHLLGNTLEIEWPLCNERSEDPLWRRIEFTSELNEEDKKALKKIYVDFCAQGLNDVIGIVRQGADAFSVISNGTEIMSKAAGMFGLELRKFAVLELVEQRHYNAALTELQKVLIIQIENKFNEAVTNWDKPRK